MYSHIGILIQHPQNVGNYEQPVDWKSSQEVLVHCHHKQHYLGKFVDLHFLVQKQHVLVGSHLCIYINEIFTKEYVYDSCIHPFHKYG